MAWSRRPKYKPEYCERLVEFGERGESVIAFCADIGIGKTSFYEWCQKYPAFEAAAHVSKMKACAFWERLGINIMMNEPLSRSNKKTGDRVVWMFFMKNRFREFGYNAELAPTGTNDGFDV